MNEPMKPLIYIAAAPEDVKYCGDLMRHLQALCRQIGAEIWCDQKITAGCDRESERAEHLERAVLVLLLVSIDLWDDEEYWGQVIEGAMEQYSAGKTHVIPIRLRHCDWGGAPFSTLEHLPKGEDAIFGLPDPEKAYTDIALAIRTTLESMREPEAIRNPTSHPQPSAVSEQRKSDLMLSAL
ncbi:MAG: hypothetical protein OQK78_08660, partial [Gammaproteobacteria bacterium]|nr:hypothetical protein [Gammaproteobacteria bacterium]